MGCSTTEGLVPTYDIIGQDRAQKALRFGLEIAERDFNVYVAGIPGTGRRSAVRKFLDELAKKKQRGSDWVYINNFDSPYESLAIRLPAGMGSSFKADISAFIAESRRALPKAFESEDYAAKRQETIGKIDEERRGILEEIGQSAERQGFVIQTGPTGLLVIPTSNGKPLTEEEFNALPENERSAFGQRRELLDADLRNGFRRIRELDAQGTDRIRDLNNQIALFAIGHVVADLQEKYGKIPEILSYIEKVQKNILDNLVMFLG